MLGSSILLSALDVSGRGQQLQQHQQQQQNPPLFWGDSKAGSAPSVAAESLASAASGYLPVAAATATTTLSSSSVIPFAPQPSVPASPITTTAGGGVAVRRGRFEVPDYIRGFDPSAKRVVAAAPAQASAGGGTHAAAVPNFAPAAAAVATLPSQRWATATASPPTGPTRPALQTLSQQQHPLSSSSAAAAAASIAAANDSDCQLDDSVGISPVALARSLVTLRGGGGGGSSSMLSTLTGEPTVQGLPPPVMLDGSMAQGVEDAIVVLGGGPKRRQAAAAEEAAAAAAAAASVAAVGAGGGSGNWRRQAQSPPPAAVANGRDGPAAVIADVAEDASAASAAAPPPAKRRRSLRFGDAAAAAAHHPPPLPLPLPLPPATSGPLHPSPSPPPYAGGGGGGGSGGRHSLNDTEESGDSGHVPQPPYPSAARLQQQQQQRQLPPSGVVSASSSAAFDAAAASLPPRGGSSTAFSSSASASAAPSSSAAAAAGSPFMDLPSRYEVVRVAGKSYLRLECIGKGGSSRVYRVLGEDMATYALKRVRLSRMDAASVAPYSNEIALLRRLNETKPRPLGPPSASSSSSAAAAAAAAAASPASSRRHIIRLFDAEVSYETRCIHMVMEFGQTDLNSMLEQERGAGQLAAPGDPKIDENVLRLVWQQMLLAVQVKMEIRGGSTYSHMHDDFLANKLRIVIVLHTRLLADDSRRADRARRSEAWKLCVCGGGESSCGLLNLLRFAFLISASLFFFFFCRSSSSLTSA